MAHLSIGLGRETKLAFLPNGQLLAVAYSGSSVEINETPIALFSSQGLKFVTSHPLGMKLNLWDFKKTQVEVDRD